ncbi:indolepyruvate oxidoreductase subunit beta family protein [Variovorax dokdonensis]|uniref:Indolepyruvate oxidoreductase subunit beta family protein n=1 Tax=Variovorax dokdonensis TaxID=344883 RepID=A0ABT7N771_9BURK|nr:indolepyruvate oxidoreductase subunit beta family protein [Variovorax dokdonensis]MDM0043799.1 indolepyruvate oxidoreductase subunit beta family protein [Variovorax dokdonensis]
MQTTQPICVLVCALGGEGGGVLTEWLIETARIAGYAAQSTSIPGVAQRTGATTYYLEVFPRPLHELQGRRPVFSLSPVPGTLDLLVSSELLETVRQIGNGMTHPDRTQIITSSARTLTTAERMVPGDGRADVQRLLDVVRLFSREHQIFDMSRMARDSGTIVSSVMLGAIAGCGVLPFRREHYEQAVRGGDTSPEPQNRQTRASLAAFAQAFDRVQSPRQQAKWVREVVDKVVDDVARSPDGEAGTALPEAARKRFPAAVQDVLALGYARLVDYQDERYAATYLDRLSHVLEAESKRDPAGEKDWAITRETARWLALWMAFDDIVRVADLKSRAQRAQRVRREVKAGDEDILKVYEHFKPGVPEFAALLPAAFASRLKAWDRRRIAHGKPAWELALKVGSHSVLGMLSLRVLAGLRGQRRRGSRFAEEQAQIERWLAAVVAGTSDGSWDLGHEIACCGRLIKGYGATLERGKRNLIHVIETLATAQGSDADAQPQARAQAIAAVRTAALADDSGKALDAALIRHGAPARPVQAQPIRWMRKPDAAHPTEGGARNTPSTQGKSR